MASEKRPSNTPISESLPLFGTPQSSDDLHSSLPTRTDQIRDIMAGLDRDVYNREEMEAIFTALKNYSKRTSRLTTTSLPHDNLKPTLSVPTSTRTLTPKDYPNEMYQGTPTLTNQRILTKTTDQRSFDSQLASRPRSFTTPTMSMTSKQTSFESDSTKQTILMDLFDQVCKPNKTDNEYRCGRDYISPRKLGEGAFGVVRYCEDISTEKNFAQKIIHISKYRRSELEIQRELSKDVAYQASEDSEEVGIAVVLILGAIQQCQMIHMFMDLMEDGSLADMLRCAKGNMNLSWITWYFRQVLEGLAYIHSRKIIHLDIKADNILVTNEDFLKIADFGLARQIPNMCEAVYDGFYGTPHFMAPEVIREELISTKSDIWAAGGVLYELINKREPWHKIEIQAILFNVGNKHKGVIHKHTRPSQARLEELANGFHEEYQSECDALKILKNIFERCFELGFQSRPSASEILESEDLRTLFTLMYEDNDEPEGEITNLDADIEQDDIVTSLDILEDRDIPFASLIDYNRPISLASRP